MAKRKKVIITVEGGVVQSVHTSVNLLDVEIILLDYDNIKAGDKPTEDQLVAEGEIKYAQVIQRSF